MSETFGEFLRKKREQKGYSVNQLAMYADVSSAQISRIENGQRGVPKPETIRKLSDALNGSYEEFMEAAGYLESSIIQESNRKETKNTDDPSVSPEEREFLKWVESNLEGSFFYDFTKSPEDSKREMMETLKFIWEREKRRKPGQKQGE